MSHVFISVASYSANIRDFVAFNMCDNSSCPFENDFLCRTFCLRYTCGKHCG